MNTFSYNSGIKKRNIIDHSPNCSKRSKKLIHCKVSDLNKSGMDLLLTGYFEDAERFFVLALEIHSLDSMKEISIDLKSSLFKHQCKELLIRQRHAYTPPTLSDEVVTKKQNFILDNHFDIQSQNQVEYDEGISPNINQFYFKEDIHNEPINTAILLYNVGQTHFWRKNFKEAEKWFRGAVECIKKSCDESTMDDKVKILVQSIQYLGSCIYREGKYFESMNCFALTLKFVTKQSAVYSEEMGISLAMTKNAMALSLFHSCIRYVRKAGGTSSKIINARERLEVLNLFEESVAIYSKLKSSHQKQIATVVNNMGKVHYILGEYSLAMSKYSLALTLRRPLYPLDSIELAVSVCNLGQTYYQLGLLDDAMKLLQAFLDTVEYRSGNHRSSQTDVTNMLICVATIHYERSSLNESRKMFEKALHFTKSATMKSTSHSQVACILNKLGSVCYKLHDLELALTYLTEGLDAEVSLYGMSHPNVVVTLLNIAQIHRDRNEYSSALSCYSKIYRIQIEIHGNFTQPVATAIYSMGLMLYRMKEYSCAIEKYHAALVIQRKIFGDVDHEDVASTLTSIGIALFRSGNIEMAKIYFEESLQIRKKVFGPIHPDVATNLYNLATMHWEMGDNCKAFQMFKETLEVERITKGPHSQDVVQTLQHLGLLYQRNGELQKAMKYFSESLDIERSRSGQDRRSIGRLLNMMGNLHLQTANVDQMMRCFTEASRIYANMNSFNINTRHETLMIGGFSLYELSKLHPECAEAA